MVRVRNDGPAGILDELLAVAGEKQNAQEILDVSLRIVLRAADQQIGGVYLTDGEQLVLASEIGLGHYRERLRLTSRTASVWRTCSQGAALVPLADHDVAPDSLDALLVGLGCQVVLSIPLRAHLEPLGCLFIGARQDDVQRLARDPWSTVGRIIGLGVENARNYARMEQQLHTSQTLYRVSQAFSATLELGELLNLIVRSAVETIAQADNCVLHLLDEQTGELWPKALSFDQISPSAAPSKSHMRIGHGVAGMALQVGQVVNIPDVTQNPGFVRMKGMRAFAAMLVAPLRLGDRPIGTLSADSQRVNAFSADDERLLTTLANQAAIAIENARLVSDLQESLRNLQTTQTQLVQSEKLSAIGQLIAGVAHELNNPLTAVMGYAQLLQMEPGLDEEVARDIGKIYTQSQRASKIVQNLLTFARQNKAERQTVDVNDVIRRTIELRDYQLRVENIHLRIELAPERLPTLADPSQLQQVLLNLINNAQDAMVDLRHGGNLSVRSQRLGDVVRIELQDDGPGLSPAVQQHLFEPFFTTKEVGRGTGLGLSICFGIISQHNGRIWAESAFGHGTTFIIELPIDQGQPKAPPNEYVEQEQAPRGKHVLVVEDEREVGVLVVRLLTQAGHDVHLAHNGNAALAYLDGRDREKPLDLIISDIKMPGLAGPQFYDHICQHEPELANRVLLITGDTLSPETQDFLKRSHLPFVAKPFRVEALMRHVAQLLRGESGAATIRRY
jgi:signal transduction histidine kinase/CheY-like chemotaxis protein